MAEAMDYKKLADLLFPDVTKTPEYYLNKYPERKLKNGAEVTRFAPSPTGYMHIGGVYQALLNKMIAHSTDGIFYLRNEDTDSKREKEDAANIIYPALKDFDVEPDEGFISSAEEKGEYGPYVQSKRKEIYRTFVKDLVAKGLAYPCFCTSENEEAKKEQLRLGLPIGYYGRWATCRNLSYEQIEKNIKDGKPFTIRIKANGDGNKRFKFHDLRLGDTLLPVNSNDYIILKSDGQTLYHLAHLVDDTLMHTTTVVRDESWFPSVPLHVQLFEYAGLKAPKYLHTPTVNTIDQTTGTVRKVSKRHDDWADVRWFLRGGYPKEAILEYLLNLLNSNFEPWRAEHPDLSLWDYKFDVNNMSKSGALFDLVKIRNISREVISRMTSEEVYSRMLAYSKEYDEEFYNILKNNKTLSINTYQMDRNLARPRKDIITFGEVKDLYSYMYSELFNNSYDFDDKYDMNMIKEVVTAYKKEFNFNDTQEEWFARMKKVAESLGFCPDMKLYKSNPDGYKGSVADFSTIIRVTLTGRRQTPDLYAIIKVLGKDEVNKRFDKIINK